MNCHELSEWIKNFRDKYGRRPWCLYLGFDTLYQIKSDIYANRYMSPPENSKDQEKFDNIPIFEVNVNFHVGAGL